ncbi:hypothetical protein AwErysi_10080 [Erysipelotrichaceae bacterium]|nr:hypothetical protein AwErysi_10080 [Erysipelotrichaceae bacterium]
MGYTLVDTKVGGVIGMSMIKRTKNYTKKKSVQKMVISCTLKKQK